MASDIETSTIDVRGLNAYLARPKGGSTSGMLLLPMVTGIGAQIREWADELAGLGITALSWDQWRGRPSTDETPFEEVMKWGSELVDSESLAEQHTLLDHLFNELGCTRVGTMGWCMGGRLALLLGAAEPRLANVVAYHPTVPLPTPPNHTIDAVAATADIDAPVMMLYPGGDTLVPLESFRNLRDALESRESAASIVHLYPGAEHGFTASFRHGNPVNKAAFELSWPQVLAFIEATTR
jgi:carboxymethylenebutenolidase